MSPSDYGSGLQTGNEFIVIDRIGHDDGNRFAKALHRADWLWVVDYREGTMTRHYQTLVGERAIVERVLVGWATETPGWRDALNWRPLFQ